MIDLESILKRLSTLEEEVAELKLQRVRQPKISRKEREIKWLNSRSTATPATTPDTTSATKATTTLSFDMFVKEYLHIKYIESIREDVCRVMFNESMIRAMEVCLEQLWKHITREKLPLSVFENKYINIYKKEDTNMWCEIEENDICSIWRQVHNILIQIFQDWMQSHETRIEEDDSFYESIYVPRLHKVMSAKYKVQDLERSIYTTLREGYALKNIE